MTRHVNAEALKQYVENGYNLVPLCAWDDESYPLENRGKAPCAQGWTSRDFQADEIWSHIQGGGNVGVRLTPGDLILDVDPRNFVNGVDSLAEFLRELRINLDGYPCVRTGSGGWHYYMRKAPDVPICGGLRDFPGLDFKSHGFQVVAAGSRHHSGGAYQWVPWVKLSRVAMAPDVLVRLIRKPPPRPFEAEGMGETDVETLGTMLAEIPVDEYREEQAWRDLMMACHHATGGAGLYEFLEWCQGDPCFRESGWNTHEISMRWHSLHRREGENVITKAHLYGEFLKHGGRPVEHRGSSVFSGFIGDDLAAHDAACRAADADQDEEQEQLEAATGLSTGKLPSLLESKLQEMNTTFAATLEGGKFFVYKKHDAPDLMTYDKSGELVYSRKAWLRMRRQDFLHFMENRRIEVMIGDKPRVIGLGDWWLTQHRRNGYEGVWFNPERELEGWLNLWTGFAYPPVKGCWGRLKELLYKALCDSDWAVMQYILNWSAYMIQHPASPAEVACVIQGGKGVGKGTFFRALRKLCGRHGIQISSPKHLVGQFNAHLRDAIFVFADEAFAAYDRHHEAALKHLITEDELSFEPKGVDVSKGPNRIHLGMASNEEWCIPATFEERRFMLTRANNRYQGRFDFFKLVNDELDDGGYSAMLYELQRRDLTGFHPRWSIPTTAALVRQIQYGLTPIQRWWMRTLQDGYLPQASPWGTEPVWVWASVLRDSMLAFARDVGSRSLRSLETKFGDEMHRLCPQTTFGKSALRKARRRVGDSMVPGDSQGKAQGYWIPPLLACRKRFNQLMGCDMEW